MSKPRERNANTGLCTDVAIQAQILACLARRDAQASTCPSEIARALEPSSERRWRLLMPRIKRVAAQLVREQRVRVTRGSLTLEADDFTGGPIRIRRGAKFD